MASAREWRRRIAMQIAEQENLRDRIQSQLIQLVFKNRTLLPAETFITEYELLRAASSKCAERIESLRKLDAVYALKDRHRPPPKPISRERQSAHPIATKNPLSGSGYVTEYSPPWLLSWLPHGGLKPFSEMLPIPAFHQDFFQPRRRKV